MASFIRGTTPTFTIKSNVDLRKYTKTKIRVSQGNNRFIDVSLALSGDGLSATFSLSQAQTLFFSEGAALAQLVTVTGSGNTESVLKSDIAEIQVLKTIIESEIHDD